MRSGHDRPERAVTLTGIRRVYGNYLLPEHTNAQNEALEISETTARYKVGRHRKREPLPNHGLFSEDLSRPGGYWDN